MFFILVVVTLHLLLLTVPAFLLSVTFAASPPQMNRNDVFPDVTSNAILIPTDQVIIILVSTFVGLEIDIVYALWFVALLLWWIVFSFCSGEYNTNELGFNNNTCIIYFSV